MRARAAMLILAMSAFGLSCPRVPEGSGPAALRSSPSGGRAAADAIGVRIPFPAKIALPAPGADAAAQTAAPETWGALPDELIDDGSDDDVEDAGLPPEVPASQPVPELASTALETWVYAEPRWSARRIGYLRAGAIVERDLEPEGRSSCPEGWYRIQPKGFVCARKTATLDVFDPVVEASRPGPRRDGLPYHYVMSRFPTPPLYARLPSADEQRRHEPNLEGHLQRYARVAAEPDFVTPPEPDPLPPSLLYDQPAPSLQNERPRDPARLLLGRAGVRSGFGLLAQFDHDGRRFGLTTELAVIPIDRTRFVSPSTFHGIELSDEVTLPVAFVTSRHAVRYELGGDNRLHRGAALGFRQALPLTGRVRGRGSAQYYEVTDGTWVQAAQIVRVDPMKKPPAWSRGSRKWIDVSILRQSLVAYEGQKPVYATLVSTGVDGIGDHEETHSTIQGAFLIHTKHVSVTMDSDEAGDEFDLRDVPFVQYFTEGYALHGAYWHDDFGKPRSHGCVNLAPIDAAWLFGWTTPEVPDRWHAALSLKQGTLVFTHP
jgi:lipoprotein-anchoring transpeptidase ErfK/SrfK